MKIFKILFAASTLTFAQSVPTINMDLSCKVDGEKLKKTVSITENEVVGDPSCIYLGKDNTVCFRFERHGYIDRINLVLRYDENLETTTPKDFISLMDVNFYEGLIFSQTIKTNLTKSKNLDCIVEYVERN